MDSFGAEGGTTSVVTVVDVIVTVTPRRGNSAALVVFPTALLMERNRDADPISALPELVALTGDTENARFFVITFSELLPELNAVLPRARATATGGDVGETDLKDVCAVGDVGCDDSSSSGLLNCTDFSGATRVSSSGLDGEINGPSEIISKDLDLGRLNVFVRRRDT